MGDSGQSRLRLQTNILTLIPAPTPVARKVTTPTSAPTPVARKDTTQTPVPIMHHIPSLVKQAMARWLFQIFMMIIHGNINMYIIALIIFLMKAFLGVISEAASGRNAKIYTDLFTCITPGLVSCAETP